ASQYIKKGMKIMVIGEVKASAYLDKSGQPQASLELTANDFKFLDPKGDNQGGGDYAGSESRQQAAGRASGGSDYEDANDIPF
ncbi:MAG TPA: hypothetical protein VMT34_13265, partial [Aggregatilineales bacterium]|nr:hypothetical protein [Aggregatilineales bacterium]